MAGLEGVAINDVWFLKFREIFFFFWNFWGIQEEKKQKPFQPQETHGFWSGTKSGL